MKLVALCTIIGANDARVKPGVEFDPKDLGIENDEAEALIARGFAKESETEAAKEAPAKPLTKAEKAAADKAAAEKAANTGGNGAAD
jgi:hypothetical protein